jgi:hypothetical protein
MIHPVGQAAKLNPHAADQWQFGPGQNHVDPHHTMMADRQQAFEPKVARGLQNLLAHIVRNITAFVDDTVDRGAANTSQPSDIV